VRTLYDKSRPDFRVRAVKLLISWATKLVYQRKSDVQLNFEFGDPDPAGQLPLDSCTVSLRGFQVFAFRSAEFREVDALFEELETAKGNAPKPTKWFGRIAKKFTRNPS
jgi:hypothetical protein